MLDIYISQCVGQYDGEQMMVGILMTEVEDCQGVVCARRGWVLKMSPDAGYHSVCTRGQDRVSKVPAMHDH